MTQRVWSEADEQLQREMCSVLSEAKRIRLLYLLTEGEKAVNELVALTGYYQPTISRHLHTLRKAGLVRTRRRGTYIYYSLADERVILALEMLREVFARGSSVRETSAREAGAAR